ncbi:DNA-binding response regulator [Actinobacillus succinogenes]|uniref:Two component transcriptional regulator, winged helix family n=1 Tax=Actinobacillus succinogenes (strain ATCC 55618 / DSM 22257 / CCUG 43843 / 130Z) TaxID=339671 RepID=A6VMF4_ACTSZ|nr:response regulator [Actinobacillus succinogenes]ABR74151.1 two component transcriptional regulator, winged helix family [Actinobacillus succinogenes 130Z]PHI39418.1 DNA-binding response regulator [Actinobacillus succinogenes]
MTKILLVDDDIELTDLLGELLSLEGFDVVTAQNGLEALEKLDDGICLVLLDVMMPGLNGIETLKRIRQKSVVPVLMLTARGDDIDRIIGLELGADDYLPKPFNDRELVARIKAILRRTANAAPISGLSSKMDEMQDMEFFGLKIYPTRQQVVYRDSTLELTSSEFALLYVLAKYQGQIISRERLCSEALGKELVPFDRTIDMHMSNLRKKLPEREHGLPWFKTVRGRGYILLTE